MPTEADGGEPKASDRSEPCLCVTQEEYCDNDADAPLGYSGESVT